MKLFFLKPRERSRKTSSGFGSAVGLSFAVVERMRRVMEERGWVGGVRKLGFQEENLGIGMVTMIEIGGDLGVLCWWRVLD
ncbi:hypothetical protein AALP_AA2G028200 [Arabis alpina]|uniref:Uncharacterized protein n=1 Tax=Arabis alpina TaxID=50452 RepID=A0A087HEY4_ARAAL|nr:hypothetical protein AALP_AA2G028200 [Arabis alpina]